MRREYARLRVDVWDDDDFVALDPFAQWLYLHLLTHPSLSFCGVVDWRPKRIAAASTTLTAGAVEAAMRDLVEARFVVVDDDTEEALVRSFVRHDGLLASPNVTTAMVREFRAIASRHLRGVVVHELRRVRAEQPELKGWPKALDLLVREAIDPYPNPPGNPSPDPSADPSPNPSGNPSSEAPEPVAEGVPHSLLPAVDSLLPAPGAGHPPSTSSSGGAGGRATRRPAPEPAPRCPRHLDEPASGACGPCGDARKTHERWQVAEQQRHRDAGPVVGGIDCPDHPGEPAGRCGRCAAAADPPPPGLRDELRRRRRAS